MKHILFIISFFALFQIGTAQEAWNACNSTVTVIPTPSYDSTFVLSAPSRAALAKGMASWTPSTSGGGSASYLVYTALLTQTGTDAPVATVLENTLGGTVVWTRDAAGIYTATLSSAFTEKKTIVCPDYTIGYYLSNLSATIKGSRVSSNVVSLAYSGGVDFSDDGINDVLVEIRVYL